MTTPDTPPEPAPPEKRCTVCGADVSAAQRVKDAHGRYYCAACARARSENHTAEPDLVEPLPAPGLVPGYASTPASGGPLSSVIPYNNVPALIAYYLSILSLLPCIGAPFGLVALILGILGLRRAAAVPHARGRAHAFIGIILGGLCFLFWSVVSLLAFSRAFFRW